MNKKEALHGSKNSCYGISILDNSYNRWGNEQLNRMDIYQLMHTTKYSRISEDDTTVG